MGTLTIETGKTISLEDFLQIDDESCQLIDSKLYMTPAPNPKHQLIIGEFYSLLKKQTKSKIFFSPIDVFLDEKNVFQPDLLLINEENKDKISERGIEGAPDLIVEVLSPSNAYLDRNIKKDIYFENGVKEYWIVDLANQTLEIYTLKQKDKRKPHLYLVKEGTVTSTVISELKFDIAQVFKAIEN
jgi:Uma2 family endonuclease